MEKSQFSMCQDELPYFLQQGNSEISFHISSAFLSIISWVAIAKDRSICYLATVNMKKKGYACNHVLQAPFVSGSHFQENKQQSSAPLKDVSTGEWLIWLSQTQ